MKYVSTKSDSEITVQLEKISRRFQLGLWMNFFTLEINSLFIKYALVEWEKEMK